MSAEDLQKKYDVDNLLHDIQKLNVEKDGLLSFLDKQLKLDSSNDAAEVAAKIESTLVVKTLELRGNTLGPEAGERIAQALLKHPELQKCLWSDLFTGRLKTQIPPVLKSLCSAMMKANCRITELDLSDNAFGPIGAEGIQDFLESSSAYSLETLKLNNNGLGIGGKVVANCLLKCHYNSVKDGTPLKLKTFVAGRNRLEIPGATALAEAFKVIGTLEELVLPQNGIGSKGIEALAACLPFNPNLRIVNFNDNTATQRGSHALAEALPSLAHIEYINFGDCLCRDSGCHAIVDSLSTEVHTKLKEVDLSGAELSADAAIRIISKWSRFPTAKLLIGSNNFAGQFDDVKEAVGTSCVDIGDEDDDQGSLSDDESERFSGSCGEESDEEEKAADDGNDNGLNALVSSVGSLKMDSTPLLVPDSEKGGLLSFLDRQLKLDSANDAAEVAAKIESTLVVKTLELRGNTLGPEAGERIAQALLKHPELQKCLWSDLFTGRLKTQIPPVLKSLCSAMMKANCRITELDLSDNAFGPIGAEGIQDFLESSSAYSLETLKLNNNGLGIGGKVVANCLLKCHYNSVKDGTPLKLKTFVAGRNRLEIPGATALAEAFKVIGTLEELVLPQNGIGSKGIEALAACLPFNPNLRIVNFNDNTATQRGSHALAEALPSLAHIEYINFGDCLCRDSGCHAIVDSLSTEVHTKLKEVDLSGAELSADAAIRIISKWSRFPTAKLLIGSNNFAGQFDDVKEAVGTSCVDIGDEDDDQGSLSDDESERFSGSCGEESDEEEKAADDGNDNDLNALVSSVGSLKMDSTPLLVPDSEKGGLLSFLDRQLKLDSANDAAEVAAKIESTLVVKTLELRGNTLGPEAGERIAQALLKHPELQKCLWSDLFTGRLKTQIPPVLKSLCSAMMKANCRITELDLSDNAFGPIGAEGIQDFLESSSAYSLETLKLNNNGLGIGGKVVANCLLKCHYNSVKDGTPLKLKTFVAGRNRLEIPGATALAEAFKVIGTLEELVLPQNGIGSKGIEALAACLPFNPNLRIVNFNDNTATQRGSHALAEALPSLAHIEYINFGDCLCRDSGCHAIVDSLSTEVHTKLKEVDLSGAELSADAALQIISKWSRFPTAKLLIGSNNFAGEFDDVREAVGTSCVDIGEEDDDQGSLSDDESERFSGSSGVESDEEDQSNIYQNISSDENEVIVEWSSESLFEECGDIRREIGSVDPNTSQIDEIGAKAILRLALLLEKSGGQSNVSKEVNSLAEFVAGRVQMRRMRPIPSTSQLINHLLAQLGFVKAEEKWGFDVKPIYVKQILAHLVANDFLNNEREILKYYSM